MNKYFLLPLLALLLAACGTTSVAAPWPSPRSSGAPLPKLGEGTGVRAQPGTVTVEVAYLNHPLLRPVLSEVDKLLANYGDRVSVTRYDFDTPEGEAFAQAKGLTGHTPLAIFVNGSMQFTLDGRTVEFYSFPQGQGTGVVPDGGWRIQDLQQVLDEAVSKSS